MKKIILNILLITLSTTGLFAQAKWEKPLQFFTPNAESLGKYGEIPVNYFNGLPNISIPITSFKVNGYELPITLSYYAGGNRPDSHPGWVGLSWNLSAGGSISRIVKGIMDEMTGIETVYLAGGGNQNINTGYLYRTDSVNRVNWKDSSYLNYVGTQRLIQPYGFTVYPYDTEPDEFQVNVDDINASFYFVSSNQIKIKSKSNAKFNIQYTLATNNEYLLYESYRGESYANCFTYINEIILTNNKGIKYFFGGDLNAIEFSFLCGAEKFSGTANTWHLKKIQLPNGEIITFNYEKDGIPINEQNNHSFRAHYIYNSSEGEINNTKTNLYGNLSYIFLQPSYLTSITSTIAGRSMQFKRSKSIELSNTINQDAITNKVLNMNYLLEKFIGLNGLLEKNYYLKLDTIVDNNQKYLFEYTNSTTTRLKLLQISELDNAKNMLYKYAFEYNSTSLPAYNSKKTDNWGFYNNKFFDNEEYENLYGFRTPDSIFAKAEILQKITYPTGGYSQFLYELNDYSKIANQFPFTITNSNGIAGGLRIKRIVNFDLSKSSTREFYYTKATGESSGILSGKPIYNISGKQHVYFKYAGWISGGVYYTANTDYNYNYYLKNQQFINQLGNTSGNHITYSRVVEKLSDGSKTAYYYTNHEKFPDLEPENVLDNIDEKLPVNSLISRELERGLLDSVEYYNNEILVKKENYFYNSDPNRYDDYVKSINIFELYGMIRLSAIRTYTFCPYLVSKKEVSYLNGQKLQTENKYTYDKFTNQMTIEKFYNSNSDSLTTVYRYPFHIAMMYSPLDVNPTPVIVNSNDTKFLTYKAMTYNNFISSPVEIIKYENNKVFSSTLLVYKQNLSDYLPDSVYNLQIDEPIQNFIFYHPFTGKDSHYDKIPVISYLYDSKSNIIQTTQRDGVKNAYLWCYNYQYPIFEIKNATFNDVMNCSPGYLNYILGLTYPADDVLISVSNTIKTGLPNSIVTSYIYKPYIGISKVIDSRGITQTYEYDVYNRLQYNKDTNGKTVQSFDYNYKH